jgi:hypothetical protein
MNADSIFKYAVLTVATVTLLTDFLLTSKVGVKSTTRRLIINDCVLIEGCDATLD